MEPWGTCSPPEYEKVHCKEKEVENGFDWIWLKSVSDAAGDVTNNGVVCAMLTLARDIFLALKVWTSRVTHEAIICWTEWLWAFIVLF